MTYQTVLLKMLDIISIRKTGPRAHSHRLNVADDVLSVLNMFQNSPFIREVITTCSSKPPSIILYTDLQMALLKSAIASGTVIGIDRTLNLSSCFLTPLCFPNVNLESKWTLFKDWKGQIKTKVHEKNVWNTINKDKKIVHV
jgi:hypothetical protein